jgi:hypothetical protein
LIAFVTMERVHVPPTLSTGLPAMKRRALGFLILASTLPSPATRSATGDDVAELRFGGSLRGEIRQYSAEDKQGQLIRISDGLFMAVPDVEVRRVRADDAALEEYRRLAAAAPQTAEAQWELSRWCNAQRLTAQKQRHLERTIELDPNHGPARQELGYEPRGNGWVLRTALRRGRGLVRDGGKWRFAEEVISLRGADEQMAARKDWLRTLSGLKTQVLRGGPRGQDAANQIRNIADPAADEAVTAEFKDVSDRAQFPRHMWLEILGRLRTSISVNTIVQAALNDPSPSIRERAYELLNEYGKYQAVPYFVSLLKDQNNAVVRSAARALTEVNDPEIVLDLVDALVTQHREERAPGNEMNIGMSRDGSGGLGGMQMGGKKVVINHDIRNPEVLTALLELVPEDVNFQYDEDRWRMYFANLMSPRPGDLRRDP